MKNDLENMDEAVLIQIDPYWTGNYSNQKTTFTAESFDHPILSSQRCGCGNPRDVSVTFTVERLIQMGTEIGLLDGSRN